MDGEMTKEAPAGCSSCVGAVEQDWGGRGGGCGASGLSAGPSVKWDLKL